jgi:hypothetical protein
MKEHSKEQCRKEEQADVLVAPIGLLCVDGGMAIGQSNLRLRRWPDVLVFETVERQEIATFMKRVRRLPKNE